MTPELSEEERARELARLREGIARREKELKPLQARHQEKYQEHQNRQSAPPRSPREWFSDFMCLFENSAREEENGDPVTEVGIHYAKPRLGMTSTDKEWTAVMGCFLSRLARQWHYIQNWECAYNGVNGIDLCWYTGISAHPAVAIEHEQDSGGVCTSEVPKLKRAHAPLSVLITYPGNPGRTDLDAIVGGVEKAWQSEETGAPRTGFLLVLGDWWLYDPRGWIAWEWDASKTKLISLSGFGEKGFICKHCNHNFKSWYAEQDTCFQCEAGFARRFLRSRRQP